MMNTISIAYWIIFFSLLPISYWCFRILIDNLLFKLLPPHKITVEITDSEGNIVNSQALIIDDKEFYDQAIKLLAHKGKHPNE